MQLSLNHSVQASQLIQTGPSRAGTKPELINLPKPIWVLQRFLGACTALSPVPEWGGGFAWAQCWALAASACLCDAAAQLTMPFQHPKHRGAGRDTLAALKAIAQMRQGLLVLRGQITGVLALILHSCLWSSQLQEQSALQPRQCWEAGQPHLHGTLSEEVSHAKQNWFITQGSNTYKPLKNRKATAKWPMILARDREQSS